ncbi:transposase [Novipirellula rosea]|uniref:Transposase n=1 Tax=Novipirellula rosea TaxID=1031540 RepID=A0ABP8NMG3_9BACT
MPEKAKQKRRSFSPEFKRDSVDLIVKQGYSLKAAADAVGVEVRTLRDWHEKLASTPEPCTDDAPLEELKNENKRLRKQLQRAEME